MGTYRRELTADDMERMRVPRRYWHVRFDEISDEGGAESVKTVVANYVARVDEMCSMGLGLLLWGNNGRGKSAAAVVIGKECRRRGYSVLFVEASELRRAVIEKVPFDDTQTLWERMLSVDMLIVDDLGKGTQDSTGYGARMLDELFRHRAANQLVTFITTNMSPTPEKAGAPSQLGEDLKASTLHVLKESILPVYVDGPDRREEIKARLPSMLTA